MRTGIIIAMAETWSGLRARETAQASGRSGGARRLVVELLGEQDCCLSAQEIHDRCVRAAAASGSRACTARSTGMDALGLVQRIDLGDGVARFEPAHAGGDHHHHLVCDDCGKVEPFEDPSLETAIERVADGRGYIVAAHDVVLRGACEDCRHHDG